MHFGWTTVNYFLDARELFFPDQELILWIPWAYCFWLSYNQWDNFFLTLFSSCRRFCVSCPSSNQEPVIWSLYLLHCGLESTFYRVDLALSRTSRRDLLRNKSNNGMPYVICRHAKLFRVLRMDSCSKPFDLQIHLLDKKGTDLASFYPRIITFFRRGWGLEKKTRVWTTVSILTSACVIMSLIAIPLSVIW